MSLVKQALIEHIDQDPFQAAFEDLQGWRSSLVAT